MSARRGQAIVEYLVVAIAVILGLMVVAQAVAGKATQMMQGAIDDVP